jgi:hypothetical protein
VVKALIYSIDLLKIVVAQLQPDYTEYSDLIGTMQLHKFVVKPKD